MVLPKAGAFLWTTLHGRILTGERLKLIRIARPNVCLLCKENEETVEHLLFWCSYTKKVWDWLLNNLQYESVRSQSLKGFLLAWPACYKKSKWSILWVVSSAMLVWHIWKERNRRVFNEEALSLDLLIPKIKTTIGEVINVKVVGRKYCAYSSWDKEMERLWNLTKISSYKFADKKQNRASTVWIPPIAGSLKVNFDGASCDNLGKSGYGTIIRDEFGNFVGANFGPLGITSNNMA
ncbi:uncharacterized protein LOC131860311 [Cryptomeria japonica]|uniref:uncharacterized protein LOC131860311 n=1 Tax=Cryptomeria japonica TaxID=3369 RepID=UPI0027DA1ED9|nr:uncharacterized protein LOC131860311 [Cryptomeria japonica]